jgi:hypothetical protein
MHTYKKTEEGPWTVGFCVAGAGNNPAWHAIADFDKESHAARFTNYLNGGIEPRVLLNQMWPAPVHGIWQADHRTAVLPKMRTQMYTSYVGRKVMLPFWFCFCPSHFGGGKIDCSPVASSRARCRFGRRDHRTAIMPKRRLRKC